MEVEEHEENDGSRGSTTDDSGGGEGPVAPAGMEGLNRYNAQEWIGEHLDPTRIQVSHLLEEIFPEIDQVLQVCRFNQRQKYAVLRQDVTKLEDLPMLGSKVSDIRDTFKAFNTLPVNKGGTNFGAAHYTRLHALITFVQDQQRRGRTVLAGDFNEQLLDDIIQKNLQYVNGTPADSQDLDSPTPPNISKGFLEWEDAVLNVLRNKIGQRGIPLAYVVRRDLPNGHSGHFDDDLERLIYEANHSGPAWDADNRTVGGYIYGLLSNQPAAVWIQRHQDSMNGHRMMDDLRTHYLGASQVETIVNNARTAIDKAHYRSEGAYSFERYTTDLNKAFQVLARYDTAPSENEKLRILREGIRTSNSAFEASAMTACLDPGVKTFEAAVARINVLVDHYFKRHVDNTKAARMRVSGVTAQDFSDRTHNKRYYSNGVDITDFTRYYPADEWRKLPKDCQAAIRREKDKTKGNNKPKGKGPKTVNSKQVKKLKATIKSLKRKVAKASVSASTPPATDGEQISGEDSGSEGIGPAAHAAPRSNRST